MDKKNKVTIYLVGREKLLNGLINTAKEINPKIEKIPIKIYYIEEKNWYEKLKENIKSTAHSIILIDFLDDKTKKLAYIDSENTEIISGLNLSMLLYTISNLSHIENLEKLSKEIIAAGKNSIIRLNKRLIW